MLAENEAAPPNLALSVLSRRTVPMDSSSSRIALRQPGQEEKHKPASKEHHKQSVHSEESKKSSSGSKERKKEDSTSGQNSSMQAAKRYLDDVRSKDENELLIILVETDHAGR
jgi:hypothetical protein